MDQAIREAWLFCIRRRFYSAWGFGLYDGCRGRPRERFERSSPNAITHAVWVTIAFFNRHRPYRLCNLEGVKCDQGHGGARKQQARPVTENRKLFQCRRLYIHRLECLAICVWSRGRRHFRTDVVRLCIGAAIRPMAHRAYGCGFYRICDCSIYERRSGCFYERIRYIKNEQTDDMHHEKHRTRRQYRPGHYFLCYRLFSHQDSHDR